MLGLEMPFQHQNQAFPPPNPLSQPHQQRNLSPFASQQQSHAYGYGGGRGKQQQTHSSEDELGFGEDTTAAASAAAERVSQPQSPSPWQRMKWTDSMVRLLVWVVHSVGDDSAGVECPEQQQKGKKPSSSSSSSSAAAAAGMQLKKGKWKSVSRVMMEKGFYVSPQQCEDKFNDLNKRYKRVNELLGKGTACKVVENPALLDTMDYLPHKAKEEARKLLSSKHLFFREMCAYHNTCSSASAASPSAALQPDPSPSISPATVKIRKGGGSLCTVDEESGHLYHEDDVADDEEEEDDYNEQESDDDDDDDDNGSLGFKRKALMSPAASSPLSLSLSSPSGSSSAQGEQQQRQWLRMKAAELEEQRVVYQNRALQLEKQRFKWLRFSSNKEREMEKTRLRNDRLRLENERMLLLLQQKEIRLLESAGNDANGGSNASYQFTAADWNQN